MATIKKVKKAQRGMQLDSTGKRFPKANVPTSARTPTAPPPKKASTSGIIMKSKKGGSFPDLNKDGKITKADILKGRGVIAKKGMKVKKAQDGAKSPKFKMDLEKFKMQKSLDSAKAMEKVKAVEKKTVGKPSYKKGGKMTKKCLYGCK